MVYHQHINLNNPIQPDRLSSLKLPPCKHSVIHFARMHLAKKHFLLLPNHVVYYKNPHYSVVWQLGWPTPPPSTALNHPARKPMLILMFTRDHRGSPDNFICQSTRKLEITLIGSASRTSQVYSREAPLLRGICFLFKLQMTLGDTVEEVFEAGDIIMNTRTFSQKLSFCQQLTSNKELILHNLKPL